MQEQVCGSGMDMKQHRRVCLYPGLIIGVAVDGILRLVSGDEGNLLVHAAVFLGSAVIAMLIISSDEFRFDTSYLHRQRMPWNYSRAFIMNGLCYY